MKRKVNRVGQTTLTVSLPSKWVDENKIKKGDELEIEIEGKNLTLSKNKINKEKKNITLTIDEYDYIELAKHLGLIYKLGYDKITLKHKNEKIYYPKTNKERDLKETIKKITERLIGAEIVSQSKEKTEIECFISESPPELEKIEKRIYYLFKDLTKDIIDNIGKSYHEFHETIYDRHDNISKFIMYFLRSLYSSDKSEGEKKIAYWFYSSTDIIIDKLRHISEKIDEYGCSEKIKNKLKEIFEYYYELFEGIYKKDISSTLIKKRYTIKNSINSSKYSSSELRVLMEVEPLLETLNEFCEYILVKKMENKYE